MRSDGSCHCGDCTLRLKSSGLPKERRGEFVVVDALFPPLANRRNLHQSKGRLPQHVKIVRLSVREGKAMAAEGFVEIGPHLAEFVQSQSVPQGCLTFPFLLNRVENITLRAFRTKGASQFGPFDLPLHEVGDHGLNLVRR